MNGLVLCVFLGLIALGTAQWNNQQYPNQQFPNQQFPNQFPQQQFPNVNELCKQPGANCKIDSRFAEESSVTDNKGNTVKTTRVCDDRGCYDRKVQNSSSVSLSTNYMLMTMTVCAIFAGAKLYFH